MRAIPFPLQACDMMPSFLNEGSDAINTPVVLAC